MKAKIGKYLVTTTATGRDGEFVGFAALVWDEADATVATSYEFWKKLPTAEEAELHAMQQIQLRVDDGKL